MEWEEIKYLNNIQSRELFFLWKNISRTICIANNVVLLPKHIRHQMSWHLFSRMCSKFFLVDAEEENKCGQQTKPVTKTETYQTTKAQDQVRMASIPALSGSYKDSSEVAHLLVQISVLSGNNHSAWRPMHWKHHIPFVSLQ